MLLARDGLASPAGQGSSGCPQWGGAFNVGAADIASVVGGVVVTVVAPSVMADCLSRAEGLVGSAGRVTVKAVMATAALPPSTAARRLARLV
jgi:hypothetical protein